VEKSSDGGVSWTTVDGWSMGMSTSACNTGFIAAGAGGVVYSGGSCDDLGWTLRRSTDAGRNWQDVLVGFTYPSGTATRLHDVGVDAAGRGYAAGYGVEGATGLLHWLIVSGTGPSSFTTVDDFQLGGDNTQARRLTGGDRMLALGFAGAGQAAQGIVRQADASGGAWTTLDEFTGEASAVYDGGDRLVVVGTATDVNDVTRVITRWSHDGGSTWMPLDEYSYLAGSNTFSGQLAADASGNVYAAVVGVDADGFRHWIVRKLTCQ
jgi:hypothetical protein